MVTVKNNAKYFFINIVFLLADFLMLMSKPYQCPDCGKFFSSRQSRYMHKKYKCGRESGEFPCLLCGYRAFFKGNLKRHITSVHGND